MQEIEQMTIVARERADKRIDTALGELHAAAHKIGCKHKIPENIAGLSIEELLGRMAYIPTMARELRRACAQELAKQELNAFLDATPAAESKVASKLPPAIEPSKIPDTIPVGMDVGDLDGVSTQTITALRNAGLNSVGDVIRVPDEHLAKMQGLGEKSVAHIRAAIAKAK